MPTYDGHILQCSSRIYYAQGIILITAIKLFILNKVPLKNTVYAYRFRHAINWPTNVDLKMQGDFS